jgi:Uma2 family endonuclease
MATQTLMTAAQFDALPEEDGRRWELLDGELIEMSSATASHNEVEAKLLVSTRVFMDTRRLGRVIPDTEFAFGEDRLRPDLSILSEAKWTKLDRHKVPVRILPDIAVEIVSPSEAAETLERKVTIYIETGVAEVWVIHTKQQYMYVHTADSVRRLRNTEALSTPLLPGWSLPLAELFAP